MEVPHEVAQELDAAARLASELAASGRRICFSAHPRTGLPTASLREVDGTVRLLPLDLVVDPAALADALGTPPVPPG